MCIHCIYRGNLVITNNNISIKVFGRVWNAQCLQHWKDVTHFLWGAEHIIYTLYFLPKNYKFWTFEPQSLLQTTNACQLTCTIYDLTCSVTCKKNPHTSIDTLDIEMTRTTRHVTLRWHFRRKCRCLLTYIFVFENITWHFEFEVECQWNLSNIHRGHLLAPIEDIVQHPCLSRLTGKGQVLGARIVSAIAY